MSDLPSPNDRSKSITKSLEASSLDLGNYTESQTGQNPGLNTNSNSDEDSYASDVYVKSKDI